MMASEHRYVKGMLFRWAYIDSHGQVHKLEDGSVMVFSRNSEDMSKKYPDLVEQLPRVRTLLVTLNGVFFV